MPNSEVGSMNSSKNKLNSEIIYNFNSHPYAYVVTFAPVETKSNLFFFLLNSTQSRI